MIGETFGNYRLVRRIGSGTMGTVFLGEHERIVRRAAIKVLAPELALAADILGRFFEEARATSLIQHPAIVEVLDCGIHPDGRRPYIAMEYLEGDTLAGHLAARGPIGWPDACEIARQMAEGLAAAHRHGIVHRDVKPANVMLVPADPAPGLVAASRLVKLLDFGVAKLLRDAKENGTERALLAAINKELQERGSNSRLNISIDHADNPHTGDTEFFEKLSMTVTVNGKREEIFVGLISTTHQKHESANKDNS